MRITRITKYSFLLFFILLTSGFTQQLAIKSYSVEEGLVQSSVYSILHDSYGYLWFGTEGGLSKFDGLKFTNYTISQGLADNYITCSIEDKTGKLWFGTLYGGIIIYDGKSFSNLKIKDGLSSNSILSIFQDSKGIIWVGTDGNGLNKYENGKFTHLSKKDGLLSNVIRTIIQDHIGNLWFTSSTAGGGICKYDGNKFKVYSKKDGLACDSVISIFQDKEGIFWLGTYRGICRFDGKRFFNFNSNLKIPGKITSIYQDNKNIMWFSSYGSGLIKYDNNTFSFYNTHNGLTSDVLQTIYQDKRGDIWIGTVNGGVNQLSIERFISYTKKDGLPTDAVYSINEDKQGNIWFGTYGGGVCELKENRLKIFSTKDGLPDNFISSICVDKEGTMWFGTMGGLCKYQDNKFTRYSTANGMVNNMVFAVIKDKNGNLWIATNGGLSKFDGKNFINYTTANGLPENTIYNVCQANDGSIWLATLNGISKFDGEKFKNISTKNGLIDNTVFYIFQDYKNNLWFGTQGGLSNLKNNQFINYTEKDGLSNNQCFFIIQDNNDFYIGTSKGINRINSGQFNKSKKLSIKNYTLRDGLANSECSIGGTFYDSKGILWFGTAKGVTRFDPNNKPNLVKPPVYTTGFKIFERDTVLKNDLKLSYYQNNLRIEFLGIDFASPEKLKYKYILDGIDKNWNITPERYVSYPYLPPGNYKFRVIAQNSDGVWSKNEASISFLIKPPFWATIWFSSIIIVLIISGVYGTYKYKTHQVKKRNIELAKMVKERTRELEDEKNKSDDLLKNILPVSLVEELKTKGYVQPREFKSISIMFTDFKGFSYIANILPADKLVSELNDIFKNFDSIIMKYKLEKLKTVGDSYMVGAGLPEETDDHAIKIIEAGLEMQALLVERNKISPVKWEMRAGVHSGSVIAGVVGTRKFTYDIWGETVNIASRMESSGLPGEINISAYTYMLIKDKFACHYRGKFSTKGVGDLDMYLVRSKNDK